ncbi:hypothetical protein NVP1022O_09 [Vibrio phage 1.022.O._10N.286.45.A10]|nr:hypothetical protein NVP1022O_09 [Vibrio phage 1.022.O._10N.286.45.A10]
MSGVLPRSGGGGAGFELGPAQNVFTGSDRTSAELERDTYTTANPSWLAEYEVATGVKPNIRLEFSDNGEPSVVHQVRNSTGTEWADNESVVAIKGDPGDSDISNVDDGQIPVREGSVLVSSGMQKLPSGQILAPKNFGVESASIDFGDVITVSEQSAFLGIHDNSSDRSYIVVDFERNRGEPSRSPRIFTSTEAETTDVVQADDSTELTGTSLTFDYTTTLTAYTNAITLKALTGMTNVRIKITPQGSSVGLKYIPQKSSWLSGQDGLTFVAGDNEIDLFDSSLALESGTVLTVEIQADSLSLLGTASGIPYLAVKKQDASFKSLVVKGAPVGVLGGETLAVQPNSSISASFSDPTTTETITINLDDGYDGGDFIEFVSANNLGTNTVVFNASSAIRFFDTNNNNFVDYTQLTLTGRSARFKFEWYGNDWRIVR